MLEGRFAVKTFLIGVCALSLIACEPEATETTSTTETMAVTETSGTSTVPATETSTTTTTTGENAMAEYQDKVAEIKTSKGDIHIRFFPDVAPNHVKNFIDLAQKGYYNGTKFHRVIPGFMIQGGDPNTKSDNVNTWGMGGSGTNLKQEFNTISHRRGIVSMARSQHEDSASSQFFIVVADSNFLDNKYTVFGQVTKGMDVADAIVNAPKGANDRPNDPVAIQSITVRPATEAEKGPAPR
jgi:cyclophilin family peptidyl-prolyl cis-trans isomerase